MMTIMENNPTSTNGFNARDVVRAMHHVAPVLMRTVPRDDSERQAVEHFMTLLRHVPYQH